MNRNLYPLITYFVIHLNYLRSTKISDVYKNNSGLGNLTTQVPAFWGCLNMSLGFLHTFRFIERIEVFRVWRMMMTKTVVVAFHKSHSEDTRCSKSHLHHTHHIPTGLDWHHSHASHESFTYIHIDIITNSLFSQKTVLHYC